MYFRNYGPGKPWLDKCSEIAVSGNPLESSILNGCRHCSNLNHSTFNIFIDKFEDI